MRLLTKTTLYFLVAMLCLLAAGGYYLFHQFNQELDRQTDQELIVDEVQWIRYLETQADVGATFQLRTPDLVIYSTNAPVEDFPSFTQTTGFSARQQKQVPYRQLSHLVSVRGIPYQIVIKRSQEQKLLFVDNVTRIIWIFFVAILIIILLLNWFINRNMWKPFTRSLEKIRGAELRKMEAIHFEPSNITEFDELNASLNFMTGKIYHDYLSMKEFTENAAHEMQTPLAVVQSKIELLLQDTNLSDNQAHSIVQASSALQRLSNLNQSLLLLAKIENNQYETSVAVSLNETVKKYLQLFYEIIKDKAVVVTENYTGEFTLDMHPLLADLMVSNLVGNAIKYNYSGGQVHISITASNFVISNTSTLPGILPGQLFKRFHRNQMADDTSNGLGLAIVKKIADNHALQISYNYNNGQHVFTIDKTRG